MKTKLLLIAVACVIEGVGARAACTQHSKDISIRKEDAHTDNEHFEIPYECLENGQTFTIRWKEWARHEPDSWRVEFRNARANPDPAASPCDASDSTGEFHGGPHVVAKKDTCTITLAIAQTKNPQPVAGCLSGRLCFKYYSFAKTGGGSEISHDPKVIVDSAKINLFLQLKHWLHLG